MTTSNDAKAKYLKIILQMNHIMYLGFMINMMSKNNTLIYHKLHFILINYLLMFRYFCKRKKDSEFNLVPEMQKYGICNAIMAAVNLVAYHSYSLIYHVNNNLVEPYNSIFVKYVGGKRIHFSFKGS